MPTRDDIYTAIRNANAAGDTDSVKKLGAYLQTMDGGHDKAAAQVEGDAITQGARNFTDDMGVTGRFAAGVGKAITDVGRGVGQAVGLVSRQDVTNSRQQDAPLMATTAGKVGDIAGTIAATAPAALIPGANTLLGGAAIGGLTGFLQPSASSGETLRNIATGGAGGALVPAIGAGVRIGKAAAEPFYAAGQSRIVGRALNKAAGQDAPVVANRLEEAAKPFVGPSNTTPPRTLMGELVPGSFPTVGQASGNAGVSALERAASAGNPEVTNAISDVIKAQNGARVNVLSDLAGADGRREFTAAARDATADQLYGAARRQGVDAAALTPEAQANMAQFAKRVPDSVLSYAKQLAKINGETMDNASSLQGMHWVKKAIDGLIGQAKAKGDGAMTSALTGLQKDLLTGMDNLSPAYQNARQTYAAMSKPVNQMDVAGDIIDKSVSKLNGNLQPNAFAKAVQSDATAARATGFPGATMEGTMEPAQLNALEMVLRDVRRSNAAQNAGRGVGSDTVQKLAYGNLLDQAGPAGTRTGMRVLSGVPVIGDIGRAAGEAYDRAGSELSNRLAQVMLNPGEASRLMKMATPKERNAILRLLQRPASGLAISAPSAANAAQQ